MQAEAELKGLKFFFVKLLWLKAMYLMLLFNWLFEKLGLHKQIANRVLEPWYNITVVCTSTEWSNFYHLRNHPKAQPEIKALAEAMLEAHNFSIPHMLQAGQWHLPFVEESELDELGIVRARKVSVARCARVSYLNHEGKRSSVEEDEKLFQRLVGEEPKHASPAEHQATPAEDPNCQLGNFYGWVQYRKMIPNENLVEYKGLVI